MSAAPTPFPVPPEPDAAPELVEEEEFDLDLDLDAYRAAQAETRGAPRRVRFGGQMFEFPPTWPVEMGDVLREGRFGGAVKLLLGDEQGTRFMAVRPPMDLGEFNELTERLYGDSVGESRASARSSGTTSKRSRRTSSGSTGSASGRRAGAARR